MRKITAFILIVLAILFSLNFAYGADENKDKYKTKINFFTGMFDWSDHKQKSGLFGLQHQNDELFIEGTNARFSPITGALITADNASYVYTGVQAQYKIGKINLIPSFTPGLYNAGNGKDLGHIVEFKSEVQLSIDLLNNSEFGFSYNHISNASLGDKNPGANSYMFNFFKNF